MQEMVLKGKEETANEAVKVYCVQKKKSNWHKLSF